MPLRSSISLSSSGTETSLNDSPEVSPDTLSNDDNRSLQVSAAAVEASFNTSPIQSFTTQKQSIQSTDSDEQVFWIPPPAHN